MDRITAQQAAEKWNVSTRTVQALCNQGRIPGAERWGRVWMIPMKAEKPTDRRTKEAKQEKIVEPRLNMPKQSPLPFMTNLYHEAGTLTKCIEDLSENSEVKILFEAWFAYGQGDVERAVRLAAPLLDVKSDYYGTISVGSILCACALWLDDRSLFRVGRAHIENVECEDENDCRMRDFWLSITDAGVVYNAQYHDWFCKGKFDWVPEDSLPAVWFFYARYLHKAAKTLARGEREFQDVQGLGLYRMYPYAVEPLVTQVKRSGSVLAEICIRLLCAEAYLCLNDYENTIRHLDEAISLAIPDRLYGVLAEFRGFFNHLLDDRVALFDADAVKSIEALHKQMLTGWSKIIDKPMTDLLSDRENEVAQLASIGMSNVEIAERLQISVHTVKSTISMIMKKTGVQKRSEFSSYIM